MRLLHSADRWSLQRFVVVMGDWLTGWLIVSSFYSLMNETGNKPSKSQLVRYVNENFASSNELVNWTLSDWTESPSILKRINDAKYREWAKHLNEIWKELARKINPEVAEYPERHSLIYVNNGFIVPGGRFKGKLILYFIEFIEFNFVNFTKFDILLKIYESKFKF